MKSILEGKTVRVRNMAEDGSSMTGDKMIFLGWGMAGSWSSECDCVVQHTTAILMDKDGFVFTVDCELLYIDKETREGF